MHHAHSAVTHDDPVHPGFGGEDTPDWLEDTSDLAFHYVDLIGALGLAAPLVVGSSMGGWIAATGRSQNTPDNPVWWTVGSGLIGLVSAGVGFYVAFGVLG